MKQICHLVGAQRDIVGDKGVVLGQRRQPPGSARVLERIGHLLRRKGVQKGEVLQKGLGFGVINAVQIPVHQLVMS